MSIALLFLILAFICFVLATFGAAVPRVNLTAAGLAFWVLSLLVGSHIFH